MTIGPQIVKISYNGSFILKNYQEAEASEGWK